MTRAIELVRTRDPFDGLIAVHALYRGWRLATSDPVFLRDLPETSTLPLSPGRPPRVAGAARPW